MTSPAGAGDGDAVPRTPAPHPTGAHAHRGERGSEALELALATPLVLVLLATVASVSLLGLQQVVAQQLAGLAAREAAVASDAAVAARLAEAAPQLDVELVATPPSRLRRPGDLVDVRVGVRPRLLIPLPLPDDFRLLGRATARVEDAP